MTQIEIKDKATMHFQQQIDAAAAQGGGTVTVPPGQHLIGTLQLKSGVRLHLEHGAVLLGSADLADYPLRSEFPIRCRADQNGFRSLIYAESVRDIALTGSGTIDGNGAVFSCGGHDRDGRPRLIQMIDCENVLVEGLQLRNAGMWLQHYLGCRRLRIRGLTAWNHGQPNNDFLDLEGCRDVRVSECSSDTDDDGITLKSGCAAPTEDVVVTGCIIRSNCNAIKLGTESNGGFRNIVVANCVIAPSENPTNIHGHPGGICGIAVECVDGGVLDGVDVSQITMHGPKIPIFIRLGNRARPFLAGGERTGVGQLRNVRISGVTGTGHDAHACIFSGLPGHPIENIFLSDLNLECEGGHDQAPEVSEFPEKEADYPEATMFGLLPAAGIFIRHARNVQMNRVYLHLRKPDLRPLLALADAEVQADGQRVSV
ncbi:MAG: glycoside hydrolase [Puniceicoccaceae bacterium]|nr:MAG: glycoside hydrolase [Puniceicoccaceae bacterium]